MKCKENRFTPEWFKEKGKEFADVDVETNDLYGDFKKKFDPTVLSNLSGEELINSLFLCGNKDNMCYELEYVKRNRELLGSIKYGTAFKYPLFKRGEVWMTGTSHRQIKLTSEDAVIKGTQIRDQLVVGAKIISDFLPLNTVEDYLALYNKLSETIPEIVNSLWVIKYYHMIFNDVFPIFYNKDWQIRVLTILGKDPNDTTYGRLGQINIFVKECEISNVIFAQVFYKYCRNINPIHEKDNRDVMKMLKQDEYSNQNPNFYAIHIKEKNSALNENDSHICIGWSELGDLTNIQTKEQLSLLYDEVFENKNARSKGQNIGQIFRFKEEAQIGDYVVFAETNVCHIGVITSDYIFDNNIKKNQYWDYVNFRKVKWLLKNIERKTLSDNFHNSLKTEMTFFGINRYKNAIKSLLNGTYEKDDEDIEKIDTGYYDSCPRKQNGENIILYGVPGTGKSWTIKNEYYDDDSRIERLVFHPDYTYSDFVGQILPKINDDSSVSYEFTPGPFTTLTQKAYFDPDEKYYLIIEEVNKGNAPAIFGDIFQLLDRTNDGSSEYAITNRDVAKIIYGNEDHKVTIPSNMSILCTMNTSDQNVFTLDTAFQRRWNMRLISNKFHEGDEQEANFANSLILDTTVTWKKFFTEINNIILSKNIRMTSSEDKRLGTHFIKKEDLDFAEGNNKQNRKFPEKVLKYLWDDAFKFTKEDIFDLDKVKSLEDVIEFFIMNEKDERFKIFKENIFNTLVNFEMNE